MAFERACAYDVLHPHFQERLRCHEPLTTHSCFGVGGPADLRVSLQTQPEVRDLICLCSEYHWPLLIIGEGNNILSADKGVRGIVAHMGLQSYCTEERSDQASSPSGPGSIRKHSGIECRTAGRMVG